MKQKQSIVNTIIIEAAIVLLASIVSFWMCKTIHISIELMPFVLMVAYVLMKISYLVSTPWIGRVWHKRKNATDEKMQEYGSVLKRRMELFHYEYQIEEQSYLQRKEKANDLKMAAIMKYTRDTFKHLNFDEIEVFQICECVRYLVTNHQVLNHTEIRIKRRTTVTQIALKNFAWNIAFQYNISGDLTAKFVIATFYEWFCNTSFDTVRKNLRTTTGKHAIEIDEHIV